MPNIAPHYINAKAEGGTDFKAKVDCFVMSDGVFSVQVPEQLEEIVSKLAGRGEFGSVSYGYKSLRDKTKRQRLYGRTLNEIIKLLEYAAKDFITVEKTTERVIAYRFSACVAFWVSGNEIAPNGHELEGKWWKPKSKGLNALHATSCPGNYNVGIAARVYDRNTFKRETGTKITFDYVRDAKGSASKLNSFVALELDPEDSDVELLPYSEEAAEFFVNYIFAICKVARAMDEFFADKNAITKAIESRKLPFIGN